MTQIAAKILEFATSDPERALKSGEALLANASKASSRDRAIALRAMSVARRVLGDYQEAIDLAERARELAAAESDAEQQLLAIATMVGPMVILGRAGDALDLIDGAVSLATTPYLRARLSYQRGVVWSMQGEPVRALSAFEAALPLFRDAGDREMIRGSLHAMGFQRLAIGDLSRAEDNLAEALEMATARGEEPLVSGIMHNLGLLASYRGDITEALRLLLESDQIYMRLTRSPAPQHVARSEVLLSAGLFREAYQLASDIAKHHRASRDPEHLANALLVASQAALLAGDLTNALATAEEAADVLAETERSGHVVDAQRIAIEARYRIEGASETLLEEASEVAAKLSSESRVVAEGQARLLVGRIAMDLGEIARARDAFEPVSMIRSGPVELRIQSRLARSRLRRLAGDTRGADAAARSGLRLVDEYQAALGATDLRIGLERHGSELGALGLDLAVDSGDPRRMLRWLELTRARALRHRPVVATEGDEVGEALNRLRQVEADLRNGDSGDLTRMQLERRRLQERIRDADRLKRADEESAGNLDIDDLISALGDRCLLEIGIHDGRLIGVKVADGRARKLELGASGPVLDELARIRFSMRRAARMKRDLPSQMLEAFDELLFGTTKLDHEEIVLVPAPVLMAAPWAVLPGLQARTLTLSPSAEIWWRSLRREESGGGVVVAGGPDLAAAAAEVREVGRVHENARTFPPGATVEEVKNAMSGALLAHIVCHATFQSENPMFSSLRLGDGDLNVYDIERLRRPPSIVVLSACDSGYTEARAGVELAGLTSALLSMGSRSVVASVGLVPDSSATRDLMVRFHRLLATGMTPAEALSAAQSERSDDPWSLVAAASFISVGA